MSKAPTETVKFEGEEAGSGYASPMLDLIASGFVIGLTIVVMIFVPERTIPVIVPEIFERPNRRRRYATSISVDGIPSRATFICDSTVQPQVRSAMSSRSNVMF